MFLAVGDGPALFYSKIVDGQHVWTPEAENQKHFHRPGPDAAHGYEPFDQFLVGEFERFLVRRHGPGERLLGEVFHRQNFRARQSRFP